MPKAHTYKFCFGPWNLSEGQDPYGPPTRTTKPFDWKLAQLKKHGFEAMMFHDDDAVPDIDTKSGEQIEKEAKALKKRLDNEGIVAEMVAPRLWFSPMTIDGAYTSNDPKPNEPMDHAYIPTIGHALAVAQLTSDEKRVGCLIETAHAILAGLDPADEIDFAMTFNKLWSL